jgi:AcrR family transcriptional regulator
MTDWSVIRKFMNPDKKQRIMQAAEQLFRTHRFHEISLLLGQNAAQGVAFREALLRTCESISGFFQARRPLFRIILSEGERDMEGGGAGMRQRWRERRKPMTEAVAAIVARGMASGEIRTDMPADVLAEFLLGMLRTRSWELEGHPETQRSLAAVADLFINGARLPAPAQA